jgi:hypothetical protein
MRLAHLIAICGLASVAANQARAQDPALRDLSVEQAGAYQAGTPAPLSLRVSAWVDHQNPTYALGEAVRIFVQTNEDAYVTVLNVGPSGHVTQLFPNAFQLNNRIAANHPVEVPSLKSGAHINVSGPLGAELIKVFASSEPIKVIPEAQLEGSGAFRGMKGDVSDLVRNLEVTANVPVAAKPKYAISNVVIKTIAAHHVSSIRNPSFVVVPGTPVPQPASAPTTASSPPVTEAIPSTPAPQSTAAPAQQAVSAAAPAQPVAAAPVAAATQPNTASTTGSAGTAVPAPAPAASQGSAAPQQASPSPLATSAGAASPAPAGVAAVAASAPVPVQPQANDLAPPAQSANPSPAVTSTEGATANSNAGLAALISVPAAPQPPTVAPALAVVQPASSPILAIPQLEQPFPLLIGADKAAYRIGQNVSLAITSFKACNLTVLDIAADGAVRVLFPNGLAQNTQIQSMQTTMVSGGSAAVTIEAAGPAGVEQIVAICSTESAEDTDLVLRQAFASSFSKEVLVRELTVAATKPSGRTAIAALSFAVRP